MNRDQRDKLLCNTARRKSEANGFSKEEHFFLASRIQKLYKHAVCLGDYRDVNGARNVLAIRRFAAPFVVNGKRGYALLTVKLTERNSRQRGGVVVTNKEARAYSIELDELRGIDSQLQRMESLRMEKMVAFGKLFEPGGTVGNVVSQDSPSPSSEEIINAFNAKVKEYFEDISKVVDENGEPLVVYHGTEYPKDINIFKAGKSGYLGPGIYFTPEMRTALQYTGFYGEDGVVYRCFVNMRNPLVMSFADKPAQVILDIVSPGTYEKRIEQQGNESKLLRKGDISKLRRKGYDGVVWLPKYAYDANSFTAGEMMVFEPNQIKSATDNRGAFDGGNPDITYSVTGGKNLAAVHSIPVDTMLDVEKKLGGLPKPSIAITRLDKPYSWGYSERVYLIGKPELADPQKGNLGYDRDAWTGKGPFLLEDGGAYDYRKGEYFEPALEEFVARTIKKKGQEDGSSFRGQSAVAIGTMDAVKAHREKLSDTDTSNAQKAETDEALEELIENVVKLSKKGLNEDAVAMVLARVCWRSSPMNHGAPSEMKTSRDTAKRILNELGVRVKDIKKPLVDSFMKAVAGLQNELEDYLESVPQRAVMFNEWEYAVMPESMKGTPGLDEMLERNGIKPLWHDGTEEGRRAALAGLVDDPVVSFSLVTQKMDARYMAAVERGDMDTAQRMVNEVARKRGYLQGSDYQGAEAFNGVAPSSNAYFDTADERYDAWQNGDFEGDISLADFVRRGMDPGELEWMVTSPGAYQRANKYRRESIEAIRKAKASKRGKVTIYRAVPADVKEKSVRNGDWVTLSKAYAEYHISLQDWEKGRIIKQEVSIDDVWWDGNDVNEWGYDDGKEYAYRNTANNRKLLAPVTYDENGDIVPLSKRFNYRSADVSFSVIGRNARTWGKYTDRAFVGRDDGMWRAEIDASGAKLKRAPLHRTDDSLVREVEKRLAFFREKLNERERWEPVSKLWAAGEYDGRTYGEMDFLMRTLRGAGLEFESLHQMVERGVFSIVLESDAAAAAKRLLRMVEIPGVEGFNRLGEVLDFPELYDAYPALKKVPVRWMDDNFRFRGIFSTEGVFKEAFIAVKRSRTDGGKLSTLLHEVQHWIQKHEGFAFGSPGGVKEHRVSAGEIEARNVQERRWMTADERAELPFNETLEYPGEALVTYSLTGAAAAGRRVLEESGDEYVANRLQEAWQKNLEKWSVLHAGKADANSAMRAVMEMEGLVKATYDVVQDDVKLGRLYMLQRWAMVYARMVESGEIPPKGALKGQAYEKFVERLAEQQRTERRRGMSREQAEELVKELGVTRLEGAMEKVARECMRAAEWHLKQKETARVKRLLEAAWPKREEGKKSPRGKLAAREYRRLEWIAKVMELSGEDKYNETQRIIREIDELPQELVGYEERVAELEGKLAALDPKQADYVERKAELDKAMRELNPNEVGYDEAKAELEDQLNWLHVFGGWADMDVSQARKAARALEDLLLRGYTEWERKVQRERERTRRVADEISAHFKAPWYATRMERKADADAMGTNKPKMVKGLRWGLMGYAQMMLALRKKLGKVFCDRQRRTLAEAHRNLLQAQKDLQDWSAMELQKLTGLTGAALEQWIASNNQNVNTGIMMQQVRSERIRMSAKEVDRLGAMSEKEYEAWRDGELAKAEADGRAVVLPTAEELLVLRGLRLEKPGRKWLEVERTEQQAVELVATKEAMLYAVLLFEQPDYEHLVEAHGLSWADVDTMKKLIGPKLLRWGYAMRRHLNENGELLAAKYEAWNGTPFGRRANYFRGVFDVNKLKPETDIIDGNAGSNSLGGSKYSILIPRRYHRQQINWQVGASQVFMLTMNEQNNYIHTQHITREWRQLLSRKGFADGLSAEIGANAVNMIKLHLDVIDAAPRADAAMTSLFGRLVQGVMKATAISSLALNVYSYMKQVSCLLNAIVGGYVPDAAVKQSGVYQVLTYSGIGAGELVRSYARVLSGRGAVSFKEMTGSAVIQSRIQSGGKRVADALMMRTGQAMPNAVGRAGEVSGEWALEQMDMIDRKANTVSAMVVADAVYRKLAATEGGKEAGDKWVRAQAIEAAGLMVDLVAQPKLRTQKGLWASHGGFFGGVGNFFYMFRSESLAKIGTYLAQFSSGDYAKALGGFMSMGVGLWLVGLVCSFLKGQIDGDDLDEEEDLLKFARKSVTEVIFGDLASLPIVGGGIGAAKAAVGGTWHYVNDPLQMILPVSDLWKRPKQLYKAVDNEGIWSFKAMRALCNCLRAGGNASGWGMGTGSAVTSSAAGIILGAAVLGNAGRFVLDVAERVTEE